MAKLKQSKNREEILEREKENAIKEGVTTKERIKGNLKTVSLVRDPRTRTGKKFKFWDRTRPGPKNFEI